MPRRGELRLREECVSWPLRIVTRDSRPEERGLLSRGIGRGCPLPPPLQVAFAALPDGFAGLARATPAFHGRFLAFELFIYGEKVLDLAHRVREGLLDGVDLVVA